MKAPAVLLFSLLAACSDDAAQVASTPDAAVADRVDEGAACDVPIGNIRAYLEQGAYKQFPAEPAVHASAGPHGGNVRTYLSPALASSLAAGAAEHPRCSTAVKELYGSGTTTLVGWAVAVKTSAKSEGGANWYWYEILNGSTYADGQGVKLCTGCHSGGQDFLLTPPLR